MKSLSLAETAFICAIPNNPTLYDPLKHFDYTKTRQKRLLEGLKKAGVITEKEYSKAVKQKITLNVKEKKDDYPDYTTYVNEEFTKLVSATEGFDERLKKAKTKEEKKKSKKSCQTESAPSRQAESKFIRRSIPACKTVSSSK